MYGIFTYIWAIFWRKVGKYSSTMEHMGIDIRYGSENRMRPKMRPRMFASPRWEYSTEKDRESHDVTMSWHPQARIVVEA